MRREHSVQADINVSPERVWQVMSDVAAWPQWTASMTELRWLAEGPHGAGSRVWIKQPRLAPGTWTVTEWRDNEGFVWETHNPGVHITGGHWVAATGGGSRATLSLRFEGLLAPLLMLLGGPMIRRYMAMEIEGLKARSEGSR